MNKYDDYKATAIPWMSDIPSHWNIERLKTVLVERKEKNSPVKTTNILSLTNTRGVIPYTEKGNIGNKSKDNNEDYHLAYQNDLVINSMNVIIGSVGVSNYYGAISPVYYALYPRTNANIRYYGYIFKLESFEESLRGLGNGILEIRKRIPMLKLNSVLLPIPSRAEQDKIVNFLDWKISELNKLIKIKKRQISLIEEQERAKITDAVLHGIEKQNLKNSGNKWIGEIPEGWNVIKLGRFCRFQNGISESGDFFTSGTPFVGYGDVYKHLELPEEVAGVAKSNEQQQEVFSVKEGDIFFTRTSETIDEVGMAAVCKKTIEKAVFSGFVIRCRPKAGVVDTDYMKYFLQTTAVRNHFTSMMNIVIRASLGQNLLKQLPVVIPPMEEQKQIAQYLDEWHVKFEKAKKIINDEIAVLEEFKTRLISDVVTGKIDVRDIEIPEYEYVEDQSETEADEDETDEQED